MSIQMKHGIRGEKLSLLEGSPAYPSHPWTRSTFHTFLHKTRRTVHEKQKVGFPRRVTHLAGSPFCQLLPCKHFSSPSRVTSVKVRQPVHDQALFAQAKGLTFFLLINARRSWLGWEGDLSIPDRFSPFKRILNL